MSTANCPAPGRARETGPSDPRPRAQGRGQKDDPVILYGLHAATAALGNPRRKVIAAYASANMAERLAPQFTARGLAPRIEDVRALSRRAGANAVHQGVVLEARALEPLTLAEIAPAGPVLAVDQVTDPRNLGALLRVAAAFGAAGLIATRRHRPAESGLIAKAASGGLEHVPLVEVGNLARALTAARAAGYWIAGLDSDGAQEFESIAGHRPLLIVLGSEGQGLRRLTREACDGLCRIELPGAIRSLNVSTAAALALQLSAQADRAPERGSGC